MFSETVINTCHQLAESLGKQIQPTSTYGRFLPVATG
jgi:hypothetical protein